MTCDHTPWGQPGGTTCVRTDDHTDGHVYHSDSGSSVPSERHEDDGGRS